MLELGYGDCKDKSLLLVAMLREIGVDAFPALVHSQKGAALPSHLPTPYAFNHAIVGVNYNGETYWIDPTLSHEGGEFPKFARLDDAYALPIRADQGELVAIDNPTPRIPEQETTETFDFAGLKQDGLTLKVETIRRGREANRFRRELSRSRLSDYADEYLDYYQRLYPGIEAAAPVSFKDNLDKNIIRTVENYLIPTETYKNAEWPVNFYLRPESLENILPKITKNQRDNPIALPHPVFKQHTQRLDNIYDSFNNIDRDVNSDFITFKRHGLSNSTGFTVKTMIWSTSSVIPASEAGNFKTVSEEISENTGIIYDLSLPEITLDRTDTPPEPENAAELIHIAYASYLIILLFVIYPILAYLSIRAHRPYREQSVLYPVSLSKFILLSLATAGMYSFIWMWKNWLWLRAQGQKSAWPFIYSIFSIITIFSLVRKVREASQQSAKPLRYATGIAVFYAGVMILIDDYGILPSATPKVYRHLYYIKTIGRCCML